MCKKLGLFLVTFQNKKKRREERKNIIFYLYMIIYCLRSMSWFTFLCVCVCVCVCDSFLHFSIARQKKSKKNWQQTFLACVFCFPKSGNSPCEFSLIMHTYARGCTCTDDIWKKQFSGLPSRGLKWEKHTEQTS